MRKLIAILLLIVSFNTYAVTAGEIVDGCERLVTDAEIDAEQAYCMGWIEGAAMTSVFHAKQLGTDDNMAFCLPEGVTPNQLVKVIIKGINEYPEKQHYEFSVAAAAHLAVAFPCKTTEKGVSS